MVMTIPTTVGYRSTSTREEVSTLDEALELERVKVPAWTWLLVALLIFAVYLITSENGAALGSLAHRLHEFFHDSRHFLGVPCH
jgi:Probable cobalt transporter subunit (CbtB)